MQKINVAIIGASGYTGLELIKILLNHPKFHISYIGASENKDLLSLHPSLTSLIDQNVQEADAKEVSKVAKLAFLALPHKTAMSFAKELLELGVKVVDLSADYRLSKENYEKHYCTHEDEKNLKNAIYGLPELYKNKIKTASLVANPGCYPTASILGVLPFLPYIDKNSPIIIDAKSGVSGAGKNPNEKVHFVSVNDNISSYNPLSHRHAPEIQEKIYLQSKFNTDVVFIPHLIPVTRGILASIFLRLEQDIDEMQVLKDFYKNDKFVRIFENPTNIKNVAGTNFCDIFAKKDGKNLFVSSAIDNLLRGASSQAVVNANLMFGFDEALGIPVISYAP